MNPIPRSKVVTNIKVVSCRFSFLMKYFAKKKVTLLKTINAVLVKNASGKSNATQSDRFLLITYALVRPANIIVMLIMENNNIDLADFLLAALYSSFKFWLINV